MIHAGIHRRAWHAAASDDGHEMQLALLHDTHVSCHMGFQLSADVLVGRIRKDLGDPSDHSISTLVSADRLLKEAPLTFLR
jgi:hypothetical protein